MKIFMNLMKYWMEFSMVFMWIRPTMALLQTKIINGLTVESVITLLLASPGISSFSKNCYQPTHSIQIYWSIVAVQFWIGRGFYVTALKALRHKTANMEVLIVVGTTSAYLYSLVSMFVSIFSRGDLIYSRSD